MIVDHNKVQSDTWVVAGQQPRRPGGEAAGVRLGGGALRRPRLRARSPSARRLVRRAAAEDHRRRHDKGAGVSFMEPHDLPPTDTACTSSTAARRPRTCTSGRSRRSARGERAARAARRRAGRARGARCRPSTARRRATRQRLVPAYGEALVEPAEQEPRIVALDADLRLDTGLRRVPRALPRPLLRVRDRRAGHGLAGRGDGSRRAAAGLPLVRLLPLDAPERADLQQRDRAHEGDLRRLAGRARARRARALAPVGPRHLGARRDARAWR